MALSITVGFSAPQRAGRAAVPADRVAELAAELAPVFDALAAATAEAAAVRSSATAEAAARRETGTRAALTIVAQAHRNADAVRAAAFSAGQAGAGDDDAADSPWG